MSEVDDFLATTLDRLIQAEQALLNGDLAPWLAMWSTQEPVILFGADATKQGADAVRRTFQWAAPWFSNCTAGGEPATGTSQGTSRGWARGSATLSVSVVDQDESSRERDCRVEAEHAEPGPGAKGARVTLHAVDRGAGLHREVGDDGGLPGAR